MYCDIYKGMSLVLVILPIILPVSSFLELYLGFNCFNVATYNYLLLFRELGMFFISYWILVFFNYP
jgi:hypothetical protein